MVNPDMDALRSQVRLQVPDEFMILAGIAEKDGGWWVGRCTRRLGWLYTATLPAMAHRSINFSLAKETFVHMEHP